MTIVVRQGLVKRHVAVRSRGILSGQAMETRLASAAEHFLERVRSSKRVSNVALVERAYEFARNCHEGTLRKTGEPFIHHPLEVASILNELGMDEATLAAGLLHDVVEDCNVPLTDLEQAFGPEVATLVNGVTKLKRLDFRSAQEHKAENLRKMLLAVAQDARVLIIKLADRVHNLRTIEPFPPERRAEIARETLQVFAPLAHRLGIMRLKWELEDRSFKYAHPDEFEETVRQVEKTRDERQHLVDEVMTTIRTRLTVEGIAAEINGRPKHLYSIWTKQRQQLIDFDRIHDLTAVRVIVESVPECYHALGVIHSLWPPIMGEYTDHIALPKPNGYQSLHTKVLGPYSEPMEVQIRTRAMHREAEYGIAAHWKYKEGRPRGSDFDDKLHWLRQLLELQSDTTDPGEFLNALRSDLFSSEVFVFTPRGDVLDLPAGATPVDFAYRIHSEIGHHCVGAKVQGRIVPLDYHLQNCDICEVMTSRQSKGPKRDWLDFIKTAHARHRIRGFLRKQAFGDNVRAGHERLERAARAEHLEPKTIVRQELIGRLVPYHNWKTVDEVLAAIGYGDISAERILEKLRAELKKLAPATTPEPPQAVAPKRPRGRADQRLNGQGKLAVSLSATGIDDVMFSLARCCTPVPGDRVAGYVTRGRGVTLHRLDCRNLEAYQQREPDRIIAVEWQLKEDASFHVEIAVEALDRVGLLNEITGLISERKLNIDSLTTVTGRDQRARMTIVLAVPNLDRLSAMLVELRKHPSVLEAYRVTSGAR